MIDGKQHVFSLRKNRVLLLKVICYDNMHNQNCMTLGLTKGYLEKTPTLSCPWSQKWDARISTHTAGILQFISK